MRNLHGFLINSSYLCSNVRTGGKHMLRFTNLTITIADVCRCLMFSKGFFHV